jgi:hypothetical protein
MEQSSDRDPASNQKTRRFTVSIFVAFSPLSVDVRSYASATPQKTPRPLEGVWASSATGLPLYQVAFV